MKKLQQHGFTLIELMVALALGLIIVAAAVTLFITGQRSYYVQQGAAEIQNNANFGLNMITKDLRHTNLDGASVIMNDRVAYGGIVLTSSADPYIDTGNASAKIGNVPTTISATNAPKTLLSRSNGDDVGTANNHWKGESNVTSQTGTAINSDQLVIQYRPVNLGGFDCEGNEITEADEYVIQRYFLRKDTNAASTEPNLALALACDAGRYKISSPTNFTNYGDAGQIIMQRVDHFRVLLGIEQGTGTATRRRFVDVNTYMKDFRSVDPRIGPKIVSVQLGILARSTQPAGQDDVIKDDMEFSVLDQTVKIKKPTGNPQKYVRQVVSQTVALRNALGE